MKTYIRLLSFLEGLSLLFLLFVAVPFKYVDGNPKLVKMMGPIHGMLFLLLMGSTFFLIEEFKLKKNIFGKVFIYSIIPFGMIKYDKFVRNL